MKTALSPFRIVAAGLAAVAAFASGVAAKESAAPGYTLHEWGTFTSLAGSDGRLLPGMDREEETLPPFVFSHDGMENQGPLSHLLLRKGWRRPLHNVRVKMETPVLYFYAPKAFQATVEVGFEGGSISQWYPQRSGGETPPPARIVNREIVGGDIDFANTHHGSIRWDVNVLDPDPLHDRLVFKGRETPSWLHPRMTGSNVLSTAPGQYEKYLFYRGVGSFPLPLELRFTGPASLTIANTAAETIPHLLIFHRDRERGVTRFALESNLSGQSNLTVELEKLPQPQDWSRELYDGLASVLEASGLYRREAESMIQTWWNSYFATPGLRVFWVVPAPITESILPLSVNPAPSELVRVLVGRSEILEPAFERELLAQAAEDPALARYASDRYFDAYVARVAALQDGSAAPETGTEIEAGH
ncbi:MAG TPA: hypothetical protein VMN36_18850 [Verrucomicrobiales bacterium]|nr:hypothetical protein [Verrucomicrobiales bacterium]